MSRLAHVLAPCLLAWSAACSSGIEPDQDDDDDMTVETPPPPKPGARPGGTAGTSASMGGAGGGAGASGGGGISGSMGGRGGEGGAGGAGGAGMGGAGGSSSPDAGPMEPPAGDAGPVNRFTATPPSYAPVIEKPTAVLPVIWLETTDKTRYPNPDSLGSTKRAGKIRVIEMHDNMHAMPQSFATAPATLDMPIGVSLRGSSSRGFPQKSFSIELQDAMGKEDAKRVLGMPSEADWAAVACWTDKPCMRNMLAFWVGRGMGRWHPRGRFVEIYFNGAYQGIYQFLESPRQDKDRVPLLKPGADTASGVDITGGYIFRREAGGKGGMRDFQSSVGSPPIPGVSGIAPERFAGIKMIYTFHYPRETTITSPQKAYLQSYVRDFETMMASTAWPQEYRKWVDTTSFADFWIINELANNVDGYWKSMYMAKDRDPAPGTKGKLYMTPFWDFNIAFGNADYRDGWKLNNWTWRMNRLGGECGGSQPALPAGCTKCEHGTRCFNLNYIPFWWERLMTDDAFKTDLRCRWDELRKSAIQVEELDKQIDAWAEALRPRAVARHFAKWGQLKSKVWPNPCGDNFRQTNFPNLLFPNCGSSTASHTDYFDYEVKWLKSWVRNRIDWLDKNVPGTCKK